MSVPFRAWPAPDFLLLLPADVPFPEGIAVDRDGTLCVGSLTRGSIARLLPGKEHAEILVPEGLMEHGAIGLRIDRHRNLLWACDGSPFLPISSALIGINARQWHIGRSPRSTVRR